jgi:predicted AAA+ superfamily ATPase
LLENIVYTELRRRGYSVNIGVLDFREGNLRKSLEVDFVANKVNERVYVQVSLDINNPDTLARELKPFSDIDDAFKKILIVGNNVTSHYEENGVQIINILDFLLG